MTITPPPLYDPITDKEGYPPKSWMEWLTAVYDGDVGDTWTPAFTNLTTVGSPTITGRYYRLLRRLCYFSVLIVPGTNTSAVAGSTYINNFPLTFTGDGPCFAVTGLLGDGPGHIVASNNRIYTPPWTTVTVPLTVIGIGEVQS